MLIRPSSFKPPKMQLNHSNLKMKQKIYIRQPQSIRLKTVELSKAISYKLALKKPVDKINQNTNKDKKLVIYTAIFGNKDELCEPSLTLPGIDLICFTDNLYLKSETWKVIYKNPTNKDPVRSAKVYKILPHRYLSNYKISIWVDGNFLIRGNVSKLIKKYLSTANIAVFDHNKNRWDPRNCIYKEAEALLKLAGKGKHKDDTQIILTQVKQYRKIGYPRSNGLISSAIILRKHHEPDVIQTMEDWWKEIEKYSRRDQLSFNYVAWKNKLKYNVIKVDSRKNKIFLWRPHRYEYSPGDNPESTGPNIYRKKYKRIKKNFKKLLNNVINSIPESIKLYIKSCFFRKNNQ